MPTPKTRKPCPSAANAGSRAKIKNVESKFTTLAREIIGMAISALIFAASVWASVFGAADDLASGPVAPMSYSMAEVGNDD